VCWQWCLFSIIVLVGARLPNTAPQRGIYDAPPNPNKVRRGHGGGRLRVFRQFVWLEAGSVKAALSRPTHQRVPHRTAARRDGVRGVRKPLGAWQLLSKLLKF